MKIHMSAAHLILFTLSVAPHVNAMQPRKNSIDQLERTFIKDGKKPKVYLPEKVIDILCNGTMVTCGDTEAKYNGINKRMWGSRISEKDLRKLMQQKECIPAEVRAKIRLMEFPDQKLLKNGVVLPGCDLNLAFAWAVLCDNVTAAEEAKRNGAHINAHVVLKERSPEVNNPNATSSFRVQSNKLALRTGAVEKWLQKIASAHSPRIKGTLPRDGDTSNESSPRSDGELNTINTHKKGSLPHVKTNDLLQALEQEIDENSDVEIIKAPSNSLAGSSQNSKNPSPRTDLNEKQTGSPHMVKTGPSKRSKSSSSLKTTSHYVRKTENQKSD